MERDQTAHLRDTVLRLLVSRQGHQALPLVLDHLVQATGSRSGFVADLVRMSGAHARPGALRLHASTSHGDGVIAAALHDSADLLQRVLGGQPTVEHLGPPPTTRVLLLPCLDNSVVRGLVCLVDPTGNPDLSAILVANNEFVSLASLALQDQYAPPANHRAPHPRAEASLGAVLLQSSAFAHLTLDERGTITGASGATTQLLGWRGTELVGQHLGRLLPDLGQDPGAWTTNAHRCRTLSCVALRSDGGTVPCEVSLVRLPGEPPSYALFVGDLSERQMIEQGLRQAHRTEAVGVLAAGMAHDFNNLLTVILGKANTALAHISPASLAYDDIQHVVGASRQAARLTRSMLDFARRKAELKLVDINEQVAQLEFLMGHLVPLHIRVVYALAPNLPKVLADPGQVEQVLVNLLVNAGEALLHSGQITVRTSAIQLDGAWAPSLLEVAPGAYVRLDVVDNGVGVHSSLLPRVFDPLFTTKTAGTGLGLSTVKRILAAHGGSVHIDSEVGKGTTVCCLWPVAQGQAEVAPAAVEKPPVPEPTGVRILVVDDNAQVRRFLVRVLARAGFESLEASDGDQAWAMLTADDRPLHLLITDVIMPGMSGVALSERVQQRFPESRTLYISASTDPTRLPAEGDRTRRLTKPFSPDEFIRAVSHSLGAHASESKLG